MPSSTEEQSKPTDTIRKKTLADVKKTAKPDQGSTANPVQSDQAAPAAPAKAKAKAEAKAKAKAKAEAKAKAKAEAAAEAKDKAEAEADQIKKMVRFGPKYGEDIGPNKLAKESAWKHMITKSNDLGTADTEGGYTESMKKIQKAAADFYGSSIEKNQAKGGEFRMKMAKDSCFFLQLVLHILGGRDVLGYNDNHSYLGKGSNPTSLIPDMFFVGNQIPVIVIKAAMKHPFFKYVIGKGKWERPANYDLEKLALYLMVVEPYLVEKKWPKLSNILPPWLIYYLPYIKLPPPNFRADPPSDVFHALHRLLLGSRPDNDGSEMKEFRDLEAGINGKELKIHSAGELKKKGIKLVKGELGITNIRFKDRGYSAYLYVPPFTVNAHTEQLLTSLAEHELALTDSQREFTSYFRFMRDLACNYKDFKILEEKGIIHVENQKLKSNMVHMLNTIVSRHNSNYTLNFRQIRRRIQDYGGPPWRLISFCLGILAVIQTIFTILSYFIPR